MADQTLTRSFAFDENTDRKIKELEAVYDRSQSYIFRVAIAALYDDQTPLQQPQPAAATANQQ